MSGGDARRRLPLSFGGRLGVVVDAVLACAAFLAAWEGPAPDPAAMRAFLLPRYAEDDLRRFEAEARAEDAAARAGYRRFEEEQERQRAAFLSRCADAAFREANPGCATRPGAVEWREPPMATLAQRYEAKILGACRFADTARQARQAGCLPP